MRTDEEILARIEEVKESDWLGTARADLIRYLPFLKAKPFLKPEVTEEDWQPAARSTEAIKAQILDYLPFAWDKANNCRGISASRSIDHMKAWLWMLKDDGLLDRMDDYEFYGKPQLVECSNLVGFDWQKHDDAWWANDESGRESRSGNALREQYLAGGLDRERAGMREGK